MIIRRRRRVDIFVDEHVQIPFKQELPAGATLVKQAQSSPIQG
ncbi:hypothetical protein OHA18_42000 [Kribbella sp. NBC_00709]|nr:hypothetical protein [Kribbella sp. NBC_00709]